MKKRWLTVSDGADERQEMQFETWLSGEGIPFGSQEAERDYRDRVTLLRDAFS